MRKKDSDIHARSRVLVLVDESNVSSSVRTAGRGLDWLKLRDFLAGPNAGRDLIEMVVYAGLPPAIPNWQEERDKKNKFVHWLRSNGLIVVTGDADFAYLATKLRRHGIRVEVASVAANLGNILRSAANDVIDLAPLFRTFEIMNTRDAGRARVGGQAARSLARARDERATKVQDAPAPISHRTQQQRRHRPRFRPM